MKKKVYISSTYQDLFKYRDAIREIFFYKTMAEFELIMMEGYVPERKKTSIEVCLEDVENVSIYLLLLGENYGSIVEDMHLSYTEMEYNKAKETEQRNKDYSVYYFYESTSFSNSRLQTFYNKVQSNSSFTRPFEDPKDLCNQILLTLIPHFSGPQSLQDYSKTLLFLNRSNQIQQFKRSFYKQQKSAFIFTAQNDNGPMDFIDRIYQLEINTDQFRRCRMGMNVFQYMTIEKCLDSFTAKLSEQWKSEINISPIPTALRLLLSIDISDIQIEDSTKLSFLETTLLQFLPFFFEKEALIKGNRLLFIYHSFADTDENKKQRFSDFCQKIQLSFLEIEIIALEDLMDIDADDVKSWLDNYVKLQTFDTDDLQDILKVNLGRANNLRLIETKKKIKDWLTAKINPKTTTS